MFLVFLAVTAAKLVSHWHFGTDPYQEVAMAGVLDYMAYRLTEVSNPVVKPLLSSGGLSI